MAQLKKILYDKEFIDSGDGVTIAQWKISKWKAFFLFLGLAILSIVIYAYAFTKDPQNFFANVVFYGVVLILAIVGLWLVGSKAWSLKNRIAHFLLTFIVLWVVYFAMSILFGYLGMKFYIGGYALWAIISILASLGGGSYLFDSEINRKDFIFMGIVFLVFLGSNLPMNSTGGFLANFDKLLTTIFSFIKI
jgi:hypothetical protein